MRIASLAPSATAMLQELGLADSIVACTHFCPLPENTRRQLAIGSFSILNEEKLAATKPDLVITATLVQAKGQARLREAGYNVLHLDPHRLTDIADSYQQLSTYVGREKEGQRLRNEFLEELSLYQPPIIRHSGGPVMLAGGLPVYMEEWHEPPFVAGNWVPDMVAAAGGVSVLLTPGQPSRAITLDELQIADPAIIIQHVCLPPNRDWTTLRGQMVTALKQRPGWQHLSAVKQHHVFSLDDSLLNMPTKNVLRGIPAIREVLAKVTIPQSSPA